LKIKLIKILLAKSAHIVYVFVSTRKISDDSPGQSHHLTTREAARLLSIGRTSLDGLRRAGILTPTKAGRRNLYAVKDLEAYIEQCRRVLG
jgi:hypothetical protein